MRRLLLVALLAALVGAACSKSPQQYLESGNKYFAEKKYKEAVVEYRNAIQKQPTFGEARLKLAQCYEQLNEVKGAYEQYVRAADLLPDNLDVQLKAGTYLLLARRFEDAAARADKVLKKDPRNVSALILKGDSSAMLDDLDGAIRQMEEAIEVDPNAPRAYTDLGALQARKGNLTAAEDAFKQAVQVAPKAVEPQLALANFYLQNGRTAEGENTLKTAHSIDPKNVLANRSLALFYMSANRAAEAEPFLKTIADTTGDTRARLSLADYYTAMQRTGEAVAILDKLAATKDGFALAKVRLAAIQYAGGKAAEGHKTIDEVLAKEPKNDAAMLIKSRFLLQERRLDEALKQAKAAAAANPRSAGAQYMVGTIQAAANRPDEAIAAFREVLKLNPRAVGAQMQISRLELGKGRPGADSAVEHAEQALVTDPGNADARLLLVRSLLVKGNVGRAETELKQLLQQYPTSAAVQTSQGMLQLLKKNLPGARQSFEKALQIDANANEAVAGLITVDLATRKPQDARRRAEARVAAAPRDPAALLLAARTYAATGDTPRAEQTLLQTIQVAPDRLAAYGLLGQLYAQQGKLDQARQKFEELAARQQKPVGAHTMVGMILQLQGKNAEAQKRYEKVLEIDARAPVAANNLAWIYSETPGGNLNIALQLAQTAKSQLPDSPEVNDTVGWIYYKKQLPALAVAPLRVAVEKSPANATYHYHLGMALVLAGDVNGARKSLEQALKLNPSFDGAADAKAALEKLQQGGH